MCKVILVVAFLLCHSAFAHSDIIKCSFTEPFLTTRYDTSTLTFEVRDENEKVVASTKNVSFESRGPSRFVLLAPDKSMILELTLNRRGSDGMSDKIYPYEVTWTWRGSKIVGGCSSDALPTREADDMDTDDSP